VVDARVTGVANGPIRLFIAWPNAPGVVPTSSVIRMPRSVATRSSMPYGWVIRKRRPSAASKRIRTRPKTIWSPSRTSSAAQAPSRSIPTVTAVPSVSVSSAPASW
jgi:hypothetical protein